MLFKERYLKSYKTSLLVYELLNFMDFFKFECCGFMGPEDWQRRGAYMPNSCCLTDLRCPNEENPLFADGCYETLTKWTSNNLSIMTSVILIISILQIFGTMFSCLLAKNIKRGYDIVD